MQLSRQTLDFLGTPETVQTKRAENNQPAVGGSGGREDECTKNSWRMRAQIRTVLRTKNKQAVFLAVANFSYTILLHFEIVFNNNICGSILKK